MVTTESAPVSASRANLSEQLTGIIATRLEQVSINEPEEANQVFGRLRSDGSTPIVVTPRRTTKTYTLALLIGCAMAFIGLFLSHIPLVKEYLADPIIWSTFGLVTYWPLMAIMFLIGTYPLCTLRIPSGVNALMTRHGKYIGIYDAGRHFLPPWYSIAYMVTRQSTAYNAPVKDCPTADNVMVKVDLVLVFHVEDPEAFVYRLGAEKFGDLLGSSAEEAIRGLVRGVTHDRAYELRGQAAAAMLDAINHQFQRFGVVFTLATVTNVQLPPELAKALENQTAYETKKREQEKQQEYKLKVLNDRQYLVREELNKKNERLAADATAERERQGIVKQTKEIHAQERKRISEIAAEEKAGVMEVHAAAELRVAQTRADAIAVRAEVEAAVAQKMASKREYELNLRRIDALKAIAANGRIVISGEHGDTLVAPLIASLRALRLVHEDGEAKDNSASVVSKESGIKSD